MDGPSNTFLELGGGEGVCMHHRAYLAVMVLRYVHTVSHDGIRNRNLIGTL